MALNSEDAQHYTIKEVHYILHGSAVNNITVSILSKYSIELTEIYWDDGRRTVRELNLHFPIIGNHKIIYKTEKKSRNQSISLLVDNDDKYQKKQVKVKSFYSVQEDNCSSGPSILSPSFPSQRRSLPLL